MTPEERAYFARVVSANAEAVKAEKRKMREAQELGEHLAKTETVTNALLKGLDVNLVADIAGVSSDFVKEIQRTLDAGKP